MEKETADLVRTISFMATCIVFIVLFMEIVESIV